MRILAIDPGSSLGWATNMTGRLEWGTESFHVKPGETSGNRWRRFRQWLDDWTMSGVGEDGGPDGGPTPCVNLVVYEHSTFSMPGMKGQTREIAGAIKSRLEEHCELHDIALQPVPVQTLKAFALPKVKRPARKKSETLEAYRLRAPRMDRSKAAMIMAATSRIAKEVNCVVAAGGLTEHEADALHLYWWAVENCR